MLNLNSTLQGDCQVLYTSIKMTITLNLVEIITCCFFLRIIVKSPSFVGFSTIFKDLCCLPNFWTLLLFFTLYLIGGIITTHAALVSYIECCVQDHSLCEIVSFCCVSKLTIVEMILEVLDLFTMMILVVILNHTNLRYTLFFWRPREIKKMWHMRRKSPTFILRSKIP